MKDKINKELSAEIRNKLQASKTALEMIQAGKELPKGFIDKALKDLEELISDNGTSRFQNPKLEKLKNLLIKKNQLSNQLLRKHGLAKEGSDGKTKESGY